MTYVQGCHFQDNKKFPDFPDHDKALPCVRNHLGRSGGMVPQKVFKIKLFNFAENEFKTAKFHDFSLTFGILWQIPRLSEVSFKFSDFSSFPGQWQP